MDGAPKLGWTASISVPGAATARAAAPIAAVIVAVVLGLITRIFMGDVLGADAGLYTKLWRTDGWVEQAARPSQRLTAPQSRATFSCDGPCWCISRPGPVMCPGQAHWHMLCIHGPPCP